MKKSTRPVYRVRAVWQDRSWVIASPDVDGLFLDAHRFDEVAPLARNAVARLEGAHSSTIDIAVQPVSLADPELQWAVERALVSQDTAKAMAEEAANRTLDARDALEASGMYAADAEKLLGLSHDWEYQRRLGRYGVTAFDDDPWLRAESEDDWNPVDPWGRHGWWSDEPSFPTRLLRALADEVGGAPELAVLDDAALPDEPFAWDGIDVGIRGRVEDVLAVCDEACTALFDVEARTACRRLLAHFAARCPKLFRGDGRVESAAGALCWIIGKANHLFETEAPRRIQDLSRAVGVQYAGARAESFLREGGFEQAREGGVVLGSAAFLVSEHRRRILELRDRYCDPTVPANSPGDPPFHLR